MHRLPENGIVIGPYGGIGFIPRDEARKSAGFLATLRWFLKLFA